MNVQINTAKEIHLFHCICLKPKVKNSSYAKAKRTAELSEVLIKACSANLHK